MNSALCSASITLGCALCHGCTGHWLRSRLGGRLHKAACVFPCSLLWTYSYSKNLQQCSGMALAAPRSRRRGASLGIKLPAVWRMAFSHLGWGSLTSLALVCGSLWLPLLWGYDWGIQRREMAVFKWKERESQGLVGSIAQWKGVSLVCLRSWVHSAALWPTPTPQPTHKQNQRKPDKCHGKNHKLVHWFSQAGVTAQ